MGGGWRGGGAAHATPRVRRVKPLGVQWGRLHVSAMIHGRTGGIVRSPTAMALTPPLCVTGPDPHTHRPFFLATTENNTYFNPLFFRLHVDRRRSDIPGFFTDMQVSSPTARVMSAKKGKFLHRLSNVGEGS